MSLHDRYNIRNISGVKRWILIAAACLFIVSLLVLCRTFARYAAESNGQLYANVAKWQIKLNDADIAVNTESAKVTLIPETDVIPDHPEKIKAGQTGYFDFVIDPAGTEVAFSYSVTVDISKSNLPNGLTVDAYSVLKGSSIVSGRTDLDDNKTASGVVVLPESGVFTSSDSVTVRFFWTWKDVDFDEYAEYGIVVTAAVRQYLGDGSRQISGETP